jgi:excisionase family DNA binding protein
MIDQIFTIPEVAVYLKLSKSKVYFLVQSGQIPHIKLGRNVRIREKDLIKWLEQNEVDDGSPKFFSATSSERQRGEIRHFR